MTLWPRTLFGRNVLLLAATTVISVLLSFLTVYGLILQSQLDRMASISGDTVNTLSDVSLQLEDDALASFLAKLDDSDYLQILPRGVVPELGDYQASALETSFMQKLIDRLDGQDEMAWQIGANRTLWLNLRLGEEYYWVAAASGTNWTPVRVLLLIMASIIAIVTTIGVIATRHLSKPLAALKHETDRLSFGSKWDAAEIRGPTEIEALASSFARMARRLEEAEAIRSETLAGLSHDLRTPLARLRLAVEMMYSEDDLKQSAVRQVDVIDSLIGQFMDYARNGQSEPRRAFSLSDVVAKLADTCGVHAEVQTGITISGQRELIERAVINLVENAQKYGSPPIRLGLQRTASHAVVTVSDAGDGFDPDTAAHLLRPFNRGAHETHIAGSGLGLAIVNRVANSHNGAITFSRSDTGDFVATLSLPLGSNRWVYV